MTAIEADGVKTTIGDEGMTHEFKTEGTFILEVFEKEEITIDRITVLK